MAGLSVVLEAQNGGVSRKTPAQVINKTTMLLKKNSSPSLPSPSTPPPCSRRNLHYLLPGPTFLDRCFLCNQKLLSGKDIYMYKPDPASLPPVRPPTAANDHRHRARPPPPTRGRSYSVRAPVAHPTHPRRGSHSPPSPPIWPPTAATDYHHRARPPPPAPEASSSSARSPFLSPAHALSLTIPLLTTKSVPPDNRRYSHLATVDSTSTVAATPAVNARGWATGRGLGRGGSPWSTL